MNLDPVTLSALLDEQIPAPAPAAGATPSQRTRNAGPEQSASERVAGEPFFWATGQGLVNLS